MVDQQNKYRNDHFMVDFVGEAQVDPAVYKKVQAGDVQLLYISPESIIENPRYRDILLTPIYVNKLVAVVIDEAHCIKTWGDKFRRAFSKLGELRSLIPRGINVMALTATATQHTYYIIKERLSLEEPVLVSMSPIRNNIAYTVSPKVDVNEFCSTICAELRAKRSNYPKTVIFVRTYSDCCTLYLTIRKKMGTDISEPIGSPEMSQFLLVDVFSRVCTQKKKEQIIESFKVTNSILRLIIATSAFGMGVDCPNIRRIYHWGSPSDVEEYAQETGRAGRDGKNSVVTLFSGKMGKHASQAMRSYVENSILCRQRLLFNKFLSYSEKDITVHGSNCCDICHLLAS